MLDYWLAGMLGKIWLRLHKQLRTTLGELPSECVLVAVGNPVSATELYRVQSFASRVWWRAGLVAFVLGAAIGGGIVGLFPNAVGTNIGVGVVLTSLCLAGVSTLQMGLLSFRSGQTRLYLRQSASGTAEAPLPSESLGIPTKWDFWAMLLIALGAFGIIAYAGLH
jgi:hypothetical protein